MTVFTLKQIRVHSLANDTAAFIVVQGNLQDGAGSLWIVIHCWSGWNRILILNCKLAQF